MRLVFIILAILFFETVSPLYSVFIYVYDFLNISSSIYIVNVSLFFFHFLSLQIIAELAICFRTVFPKCSLLASITLSSIY